MGSSSTAGPGGANSRGFGGGFGPIAGSGGSENKSVTVPRDGPGTVSVTTSHIHAPTPAPFLEGVLTALGLLATDALAHSSGQSASEERIEGRRDLSRATGASKDPWPVHPLGRLVPGVLALLDGTTLALACRRPLAAAWARSWQGEGLGGRRRQGLPAHWEVPRRRLAVDRSEQCISAVRHLGEAGSFESAARALDVSFSGGGGAAGPGGAAGVEGTGGRRFEAGEGHGLRKELFLAVGQWFHEEGEAWEELAMCSVQGREGAPRLRGEWTGHGTGQEYKVGAGVVSTAPARHAWLGSQSRQRGVLGRVRWVPAPQPDPQVGDAEEVPQLHADIFEARVTRVHVLSRGNGEPAGTNTRGS